METLQSVINPEIPLSFKPLALIFLVLSGYEFLLYGIIFAILYPLTWGSHRPSMQTRKIQSRSPSPRDIRREISYALLAILVFNANSIGILLLIRLGAFPFFHEGFFTLPWYVYLVSLLAALPVADLYSYGVHRLLHTNFLYRKVHHVHHQSLYPSPVVAIALHPLEAWLVVAYIPLMAFLVPTDFSLLLILQHLMIFIGVRNELGYQLGGTFFAKLGLDKLFSTSTFHVMHHIYPNYNFGLNSRWMDQIFKTEHPRYEKIYLKFIASEKSSSHSTQPSIRVTQA